jgi:NACHT domain
MEFSDKCKVIENIDDEVKILHPLLRNVLRQIDGVTEVEYTHGQSEKGADLIVTRFDKALERSHQIGVIAKIGKVLNNFTDIERQIDECQMPRKIQGGTSEVCLSEVWVINTSSISTNAKDKIRHKYTGQRIEFFSGEKLAELVDKYGSYFWHDISSDIGSYLQDLSRKIEQREREVSILGGLGCDDFYIDPDVQEFEKSRYLKTNRPTKPTYVNFVEAVLKEKVSVLEGEMGFGKSKTARHIAMHYCALDRFKKSSVLPIFDTFRNLLEKGWTLSNLLDSSTSQFFDAATCKSCTFLFIIDGVDEALGKNGKFEELLSAIIKEARSVDGYHLVLTSRPLHRLDEQVSIYAGARRYSLMPLSMHKLVAFIEKACEKLSIPKRIFEDLQRSDLFKQLPQSPIAAALLSRLISQNTNDLPSNLTELFSKSIEHLLGRWDISKGECTEKEYRDAELVSLDIADYLVGNHLIYMSESEARQRIATWHSDRNTYSGPRI